ncbi:hypothetical protein [Mangrovihabitans endophyticus]|uniref:Uncharacterized protein n=1 Tax=Mangrovihabitans endophyticus TaxID=1751298 RepID=A0A8J3FQP8_9ACTN|nr:hypothetical protein [Mangrovihabitans endophyticus]GGL05160.1 hypothetical protein GCM10012284_44600 [Mangrovihabitans endophyticus]
MTTPVPARLRTHGWLDWPATADILTNATCAWADTDGFHIAERPDHLPATSHLWAWTTHTCWRARIDSSQTLLTELTLNPTEPHPDTIEVHSQPGIAWPTDYGPIGPQPPGVLTTTYTRYTTPNHNDATGTTYIHGENES